MLHSGQNFTIHAKNVPHSKIPGLHLSAAPGAGVEEAVDRLTSAACTQLDVLLLGSPGPHPGGTGEDVGPPPMRLPPLKLAPLQLPEEKQNLTGIHKEDKRTSGRARKKAPKGPASACAVSTPTLPTKEQQWPQGARPVGSGPVEQASDGRLLEDIVCRASMMHIKPSPPSSAPQETGRRRLRLSRTQHLEEGRLHNITTPTGGLKPPASPAPPSPPPAIAPPGQRAAGRESSEGGR